jgi:uncharacterized protein YdiU (UPF0061 family)
MESRFDNSYARELDGFYARWAPAKVPAPELVYFNAALADELGLAGLAADAAAVFSGNHVPDGADPIAQAYAGHQFGGFNPSLGDGRALLLGEVVDAAGRRRDVAFKGSGRTPFSRGGDGKAALGPVLREVLLGEAMHGLGIPSTRALAAVTTGEAVIRERRLPGAILTRVAASHLRVGTFQFFAARGEVDRVTRLLDYAIARHDPNLVGAPDRALRWLDAVIERQTALIARWMHVGFIHGVMNTDNMTISGETIDFGPCAFLEAYDPDAAFSSIDHAGRYAYSNQATIVGWNLARLAETVLDLVDPDPDRAVARATELLRTIGPRYEAHWLRGARAKLGLTTEAPDDAALASSFLDLLAAHAVDFTLAWRRLADAAAGDEAPLRALFPASTVADDWLARWRSRLADEATSPAERAAAMRGVSPATIARNHRVEEALAAAATGDQAPLRTLLDALASPFEERAAWAHLAEPAPKEVTACYQTFCGT